MDVPLDPASALARLAAGVIVADGRITSAELASAAVLDELGLGPMRQRLIVELERLRTERIDLEPAIATVSTLSPRARAVIFEVLAELAAADGDLSEQEALLLDRLVTRWDLETKSPTPTGRTPQRAETEPRTGEGVRVVVEPRQATGSAQESAMESRAASVAGDGSSSETERALAVLGLPSDASPAAVEEAFRALVHRYDPAHVIDLGPEFAILAIRRLSRIADAYVAWKRYEKSSRLG